MAKVSGGLGPRRPRSPSLSQMITQPIDGELFSADQQAVIRLASEMTREGAPAPQTRAAAAKALDGEKGLVELVGVVGAYNMVSRIIITLDIRPETETGWT